MENKGKCKLCKDVATIFHHITYFPQKIIPVCDKCHKKIHEDCDPKYVKYGKGDPKKFYRNKKKSERDVERYLRRHKWGFRYRRR